jgi:tetratricopeptide (TPR) repeat protein
VFAPTLATASCWLAAVLQAHPEMESALERLNARIATAPTSAELYLERGELYAQHQEWIPAEANYLCAAELAPALPRLERALGLLSFATGDFRAAREHFERALAADPRDAESLIFRARIRARTNDRTAALADFDAALAVIASPRPELLLERASLCATVADAIRGLDAAIARIGPIHTLQLRALELETTAGLTDAALARLAAITHGSERKESWLKRRGDLLLATGRIAEAREAYAAALAAIQALPDWLRESPDVTRLMAELTRLTTNLS